jgi:hypothetical protein
MSESEPSDEASRKRTHCQNPKNLGVSGISIAVTCLLAIWQSSLRRHDFYLGLLLEHGKSDIDVKEKVQVRRWQGYYQCNIRWRIDS